MQNQKNIWSVPRLRQYKNRISKYFFPKLCGGQVHKDSIPKSQRQTEPAGKIQPQCICRHYKSNVKEIKTMNAQQKLIHRVKLAKVENEDWTYKQMAEVIDIDTHSFYNWMNGCYKLSDKKYSELSSLIDDLLT